MEQNMNETTEQKVKTAVEQYNRKATQPIYEKSNNWDMFRSGYIYGMVRANEEGCLWGLEQGKAENEQLKGRNKELLEAMERICRVNAAPSMELMVDKLKAIAKAVIESNNIK